MGSDNAKLPEQKAAPDPSLTPTKGRSGLNDSQISQEEEEYDEERNSLSESEDEGEDEEPRLKYAPLTKSIAPLYRKGDATSSFLVAGDNMVVGTHNGNIHIFDALTLERIRIYRAHSASVTSVSISPLPPPPSRPIVKSTSPADSSSRLSVDFSKSPEGARQAIIQNTASNAIYIATSSIDGNVCISSLVDPKDVLLRNFGRPVQAVALSPEYKSDKSYISGGLAGNLILTVGGRAGTSTNSTIMTGVTSTSPTGWLGALNFGGGNGRDTILHSGEGSISTIKWSLSGKYVVWANEEGIKIMRSNLHLDHSLSEFAWKRMSHVDRPRSPEWDEMVSVWKARAEWVDEDNDAAGSQESETMPQTRRVRLHEKEKLIVGWGGTVWIINVFPAGRGTDAREKAIGSAEVVTILRTDCIISGVSLYTPNVLLVLSYLIPEDNNKGESKRKQAGPARGVRHRQNGLEPELRLINVETKEELSADTLAMRRYESLSASDYHLGVLSPSKFPHAPVRRGAFETIGTGILDATLYPTRLFSSANSIRSTDSGDKKSGLKPGSSIGIPGTMLGEPDLDSKELAVLASDGIKIFIHSPYDCVAATKRDVKDRLSWLKEHKKYEEAWELIAKHPEAASLAFYEGDSALTTPKQPERNLTGLFVDGNFPEQNDTAKNPQVQRERQQIGESWLEQLVNDQNWEKAGDVCGKVLDSTLKWEHWIWIFAKSDRFDEIVSHVPIDIYPPLPSLIYEVILGHYVSRDRSRFKELLDLWSTNLFDVDSVVAAINDQLKIISSEDQENDWRLLTECLAKLLLAGGRYREALRCYVRLHDAETAMTLIRDHHLLDAVADDIPGLILIRVPKEKMKSSTVPELEEATSEPIKLLVREAVNGIVRPDTVISQLQASGLHLFLYFYVRALWKGDSLSPTDKPAAPMRGHHRTGAAEKLAADDGRLLIDAFADTAVKLFADYDRPLLMEFLKSNTSYSYNEACSICESRHFIPELIYLFSKTGQTKRALHLILSDLKDISHAISFAKSQDDPDLWDDLLSYSMDKPEYIRRLLVEAGTAIDPIKLVRRIPSGLEIQGLREGLTRMIREHDIQASISHGVAKVLVGEVSIRMDMLRKGQRRGIRFDILHESEHVREMPQPTQRQEGDETRGDIEPLERKRDCRPGCCAGCQEMFVEQEKEPLVGFACGHVYHISHIHPNTSRPPSREEDVSTLKHSKPTSYEDSSPPFSRTVGVKVTNARLLREKIGDGCQICALKRVTDDQ
ncbi:Vacuolar protein sorting-associated protein 41 [Ophidiomyces ophidiicola]|nr:Vacuolar protein sorting-associated protein 41 [Ophidiomyces ophidiicola]